MRQGKWRTFQMLWSLLKVLARLAAGPRVIASRKPDMAQWIPPNTSKRVRGWAPHFAAARNGISKQPQPRQG